MWRALSDADRKTKEAAVAGHDGGRLYEVIALLLHGPLLLAIVQRLYACTAVGRWSQSWKCACETLIIVLPLTLCVSVLADSVVESLAAWATLYFAILGCTRVLLLQVHDAPGIAIIPGRDVNAGATSYLGAARSFKGFSALMVALCILAVDFQASFPRRYCKTEARGTALMDLGGATTVIASGLLSGVATGRKRSDVEEGKIRDSSAQTSMTTIVALISLGLLRWLALRALNYQQHESEYGRNWNFFVTIAFVNAGAQLLPSRSNLHSLMRGLVLLCLHQLLLLLTPLATFVLSAERELSNTNADASSIGSPYSFVLQLWHSDREGIISVVAMLTALWLAQGLGGLYRKILGLGTAAASPGVTRAGLFGVPFFLVAMFAAASILDPPSRRLGNAAHVCSALVASSAVMSGFCSLHHASCHARDGVLLPLLSDHALSVFLVSNVLTGAVNLSVDTARVSPAGAAGLLSAYLCLVVGAALLLDARRGQK